MVYKVTPEGRIHYIDTHPDNSLTRGVYGKAFTRSSPAMGAGFKRWRPQTLVGATQRPDGSYQGGHIVLSPDKDIADWSDEQFFGTEKARPKTWSAGRFVLEGETLEYYDYVRRRLANAGFKYDPLEETRSMVRSLCEDLKYRVDAVDVAIKANIHKRPQPDRLPNNIYGTDGDWETYSTPSRDARLKTAFKELRDEVARFLELAVGRQQAAGLRRRGPAPRPAPGLRCRRRAACTITYAQERRQPEAARLRRGGAAPVRALVRSASLRRAPLGRAAIPRSLRPAPTRPTSAPGTRPSSACATSPTAPTTCAWASRSPTSRRPCPAAASTSRPPSTCWRFWARHRPKLRPSRPMRRRRV